MIWVSRITGESRACRATPFGDSGTMTRAPVCNWAARRGVLDCRPFPRSRDSVGQADRKQGHDRRGGGREVRLRRRDGWHGRPEHRPQQHGARHEIIRQGIGNLTLVGCNLALSMDLLVGAGLVKRTESGTGNLERYGATLRWRRAIEAGELEVVDYSHLGMASRFLAGALGVPFMPSKSLLGTDILNKRRAGDDRPFELVDNPWNPGEPVVLLPACRPDVSILHVQQADEMGNIIIDGFTTQEPEMARASRSVIVSCERLIDSDEVRRDPDRTTIPYIFVDAVVVQPWGRLSDLHLQALRARRRAPARLSEARPRRRRRLPGLSPAVRLRLQRLRRIPGEGGGSGAPRRAARLDAEGDVAR